MKSKCSSILKVTTALVLAVLMMVSSISTVVGAVVSTEPKSDTALTLTAKKVVDIAETGAKVDLAETGALSVAGKIYFIKPADWTYAALMIGHSSYSAAYQMSNISGTDLYYVKRDSAWSDSTEFAFFDVNGWGTEGNRISHRAQYAAHSSTVNSSYAMNAGSTYLIATTANSPAYYSAGYSAFNKTLTIKTMLKNGSSYEETTTKCGTFSASGAKKLTADGTSGNSSISQTNGTATLSTARTNTATISQTAESGYTFKGWKASSDSTGSGLSTGDYSFTNSGSNTTIYAYYEVAATNYTGITAVAKGTTDGSSYTESLGTIQSSTTVSSATGLAVSAGTQSGYSFYKWVASGSGTFDDANSASTTFHPAANSEVATAQYKKNYTITQNTPTGGTVSLDYTSRVAGQTYTVTLAPSSGYKIKSLTVGGTDVTSSINSSNEYTGTASGTNATIAVVATFEAIPATTIYIKKTMPKFTHIHLWSTASGSPNISDAGAWPGDKFTSWSTTTDGKYYYKAYTWDCDKFKFILNDGKSSGATQTSDSDAYATGKSYYIDSATANSKAVLTEGTPQASTITYTTGTGFSYGTTKPASAYTGETVSFTVTASSGYRIDKVQYTPAGGAATTITASSGTYSFTMPDKNVTVSVTVVKTYTVTLSASGTGMGTTKQYFVGTTPGTYSNYSSAITVDAGKTVYFKVSYANGYEYNTVTNATVYTANTVFKTAAINANTTVTITAKKISYSVSVDAKYSTDGSTFNTAFSNSEKPAVTIGAATATQLDGVSVTAPATDPTGYVFAGWATNAGNTNTTYFANYLDKDTTFKPRSGNTQAIARYKKIFTITSSVDSTGTGAGTVTTSETEVVAGGSYTITATAKTGSAIESVKVNDTAKSATASQTISSVSANQVVIVKFKSNVYLRGGSTIGTNWTTGDAMTSNSDGTEFVKSYENVAGSSSGTQYQFKLYVNGYNNDGTAAINITGGTGTGTCTHQSSGDQNYVLTLKQACNVTVKSNGTKITEIKVVPANATKYAITFKKVTNTTISGTYEGTNFSTASADAVVQVYSGDEISFTVTAATGYHISALTSGTTPTFSPAVTKTYKLSNVTAAKTITPAATADVSVTAKSNKTARGTVTVDKSKSYKGATVKITVSPKNGVLKSLTATYANGYVYEYKNSSWTVVTAGTAAAAPKLDIASIGANIGLTAIGASSEINMTMQYDSAVTINATFDAYSAESNYYYNGYKTNSSTEALSAYWGKQMTEGMLGGEKFSYYHVTGRGSESGSQCFTVSDGAVTTGTRYVYFTQLKSGGWDYSHSPWAYFIGASNSWPGYEMTWYTDNDMGQPVYRVAIPAGATGVVFNDNNKHKSTDITDLSAGGYYVDEYSTWDGSASVHDGHSYSCSYPDAGTSSSGTEILWSSGSYVDQGYTGGFYDYGQRVAQPKDGNGVSFSQSNDDYYIVVLYAGKTYYIDYNGHTNTKVEVPSDKIYVIWMSELPSEDENLTVYAKDGSIRSDSYGSTYANIADTKIYKADGTTAAGTKHNGNVTNQTWETYKAAKGDTIVIKTQIGATDSGTLSDAADLKAKYYVRGFCVNGEVSELLTWNADGLYTLTYKVPEDYEGTKIEITPIYYLKDTTANPIVTYRVTGFTDELKAIGTNKPNWGNTLYTYPFYGKLGGQNNALGAYPGQPMVYYKGQYQMQIPQKSTAWDIYLSDTALSGTDADKRTQVANTNVSGVTMSNGYYDIVHRQIMGYGDNSTSADHVQTYDYGDFFKIFNEKKPVDNIVFDFKYRTKKHNFENQPATSIAKSTLDTNYGTNGNGFELLTNFHGRTVDLFGTPLSGDAADPSKTTPVYVVSIGGVNGSAGVENIAGYYATEWMVYGSSNGTNYSRITAGGKSSIPPEVLVLNDDDATSFNETTYPSADATHKVTDWKALYTALEAYRNKPVMISYEAADAQIGSGNYATSGGGGATRNDGRWLYSKIGENITSKIKIQYSDDDGNTYTDLNTTTPQVSGLYAYFTNSEVEEGAMTFSTTIDPDKTFDFEAKRTNANYKFVGWFMEDGTKITTENVASTERSGSYTFVAKFMQVSEGQLTISHTVDTDTTYKGSGTVSVSAVVYDDNDEVFRTYAAANSITMDEKVITSEHKDYRIVVTLTQAPNGEDTFAKTTCDPAGTKFLDPNPVTSSYATKEIEFTIGDLYNSGTTTQSVLSIMYHTFYTKTEYRYKYTFNFKDRSGADKQYVREGTLSAAQREAYVSGTGNESRVLSEAFVNSIKPHESNFNQNISFTVSAADRTFTQDGSNYTLTKTITAEQTESNTLTATFDLPYAYDANGCATADVPTISDQTNFVVENITFNTVIKKGDNYIIAPKTVNDGGTTKYFQYWSVAKTSAPTIEVARCYFNSFNLVAFDNYTITPKYETTTPSGLNGSGIFTTASYLETTRNQYNGDGTDAGKSEKSKAADILYNDFVLAYNYNAVDIYKNDASSSNITELGYVVERVQKLELQQDGKPYTDPTHYSSKGTSAQTESDIKNFIATYSGNKTSGTLSKVTITKDSLDNKNRIEFFDAYYNSAGWKNSEQKPNTSYGYKNYVYKVYSYMIVDGTVTLCANPVYFTMYEEAVK